MPSIYICSTAISTSYQAVFLIADCCLVLAVVPPIDVDIALLVVYLVYAKYEERGARPRNMFELHEFLCLVYGFWVFVVCSFPVQHDRHTISINKHVPSQFCGVPGTLFSQAM